MNEQGKTTSYITSVISGAYDYVNMTKEELIAMAIADLKKVFLKVNKPD